MNRYLEQIESYKLSVHELAIISKYNERELTKILKLASSKKKLNRKLKSLNIVTKLKYINDLLWSMKVGERL